MIWDFWTFLRVALGVAGVIVLTFGWDAWERWKAVCVPQEEIDRLAAERIVQYGTVRAKRFTEANLDRARRRGETGEYWLLVRVRETIERMEASGSDTWQ